MGLGSSSHLRSELSESSSSMISLHRSMHSSQMYTPGPAMSFLTCFWLFPQKEHLSRSPPSPMRATRKPLPLTCPVCRPEPRADDGTPAGPSAPLFRAGVPRTGASPLLPAAAWRRGQQLAAPGGEHPVDEAVLDGLLGG